MSDEDGRWRRPLVVALALSLLLHLLFVLLLELTYTPPETPPVTYRVFFQLPTLVPSPSPFAPGQPGEGFPQPLESLEGPGLGPLPGEPGFPGGAEVGLPYLLGPLSGLTERGLPPPKPLDFKAPELWVPDFDSLAIARVRRLAEERESYARFRLFEFDADTTDEESRRRSRARQIVERAIEAMGGRAALVKIREMKARVWVEATEYWIPGAGCVSVQSYAYPVAIWYYTARGTFTNQHIEVKLSLDPNVPNPSYVLRPPCNLGSYYYLFDSRWSFPLLPTPLVPQEVRELQKAGKLREQGEAGRWHFIDRFLGEGIDLSYIGAERFESQIQLGSGSIQGRPVDVIRVEDEKYGSLCEAFFDQETGLLLAVREGLTPAEQQLYMRAYRRTPPVWTTIYGNYKPIHGVLTPHRLVRSGLIVHLKIAYNGEEPDPSVPDIEE